MTMLVVAPVYFLRTLYSSSLLFFAVPGFVVILRLLRRGTFHLYLRTRSRVWR
jgi:hypothetical protein